MYRRKLLLGVGAVITTVLAGCVRGGDTVDDEDTQKTTAVSTEEITAVSTEEEEKGLEYLSGSAACESGREGGWVTFSMKNFTSETIKINDILITSDTEATRLDGNDMTSEYAEIYIDVDGDEVYDYRSEDGYAYTTLAESSDSVGYFDIGATPEIIRLITPTNGYSVPVIQPDANPHFSLYQFQKPNREPVDLHGAELSVSLFFADRPDRTYSIILPETHND